MTFSIELLPAPLGPMIERISCSRTSKEISVSALTPPKRREMFCRSRMTSPIFLDMSGSLFRDREGLGIDDLEVGGYLAATTVLERDLGFDELIRFAFVEGVDQQLGLFGNEVAPDRR